MMTEPKFGEVGPEASADDGFNTETGKVTAVTAASACGALTRKLLPTAPVR
jgi:hypothetical protein